MRSPTRLQLTAGGQVVLQLRHPWADGTTHVAFTPSAFLERLAVLVPRPRVNLVLYQGLLAPRAESDVTPRPLARGASWADLMRRAFEAACWRVPAVAVACGSSR